MSLCVHRDRRSARPGFLHLDPPRRCWNPADLHRHVQPAIQLRGAGSPGSECHAASPLPSTRCRLGRGVTCGPPCSPWCRPREHQGHLVLLHLRNRASHPVRRAVPFPWCPSGFPQLCFATGGSSVQGPPAHPGSACSLHPTQRSSVGD